MERSTTKSHVNAAETHHSWLFMVMAAMLCGILCLAVMQPAHAFAAETQASVGETNIALEDGSNDDPAPSDGLGSQQAPSSESETDAPAPGQDATVPEGQESPDGAPVDPAEGTVSNDMSAPAASTEPGTEDADAEDQPTEPADTTAKGASDDAEAPLAPTATYDADASDASTSTEADNGIAVAAAATAPEEGQNVGSTAPQTTSLATATVTCAAKVVVQSTATPTTNIVVTLDGKTLVQGTDYTVSYSNNTKVGKNATLIITGIGAYAGTLKKTYEIVAAPTYTKGATRMPVLATSAWKFSNATWKASNANIKLSGKTVTAVKAGTSYVYLYNLAGQRILKQKITVYALNGAYVLNSYVGGGEVLDIANAEKADCGNAHIWKKNGTQAQTFLFYKNGDAYEIVNANSKKALDVSCGSKDNGANVQQYTRNNTDAQKWRIRVDANNRLSFINVGSGKALDVAGALNANGTNVHQYSYNGTNAQQWKLTAAPVTAKGATSMPVKSSATWSVTNRGSIKLLSGTAVSVSGKTVKALANGTAVIAVLDSMGNTSAKKTVTVYSFRGKYFIVTALSKKYALEISGAAAATGGNAEINTKYGYSAQAFTFSRSGDYYTIKNVASGKVLDVAGGSKKNSANVQQYASNGTNAQKWTITVDASNRLTFLNVGSGKALDVSGAHARAKQNVQQYTSNGTKAQKWTLATYTAAKFSPGDYLAAACVALSGCYGASASKVGTSSGKAVANNMRPTGSGWAIYNKVHDKVGPNVYTKGMYSSTKYYTDCGGNVALAVGWSGIDDDYVRSCSAREQEKYLKASNKWDSVGTYAFKDVHSGKVNLKPGDIISINGYSHVAIYTGTTAASLKYDNATKTYYEAQLSAKEWAHLVSYSKSSTTFNVYRRNSTDFNYTGSTYYNYLKSEREKYLVAGK